MKRYYNVSFQYSETTFCTNIALAESEDAVKEHYKEYQWCSVRPAEDYEVSEAAKKGMPIININTPEEPEEAQTTTEDKEEATMTTYRINQEQNGIEIMFTEKPEAATLEALKAAGYRWHRVKKLWYAKNTAERMALAQELTGADATAPAPIAPKAAKVEQINMEGVVHKAKTCYGSDFAKIMREEFKARGVKGVTVRANRSGWTDSITVTVKATQEDFASVEEMTQRYTKSDLYNDIMRRNVFITGNGWQYHYYTCEEWEKMTTEEREELHALYVRQMANRLSSVNDHHMADTDRKHYFELTTAFFQKMQKIVLIANQWNWNKSDIQSDYFDVGYYLDIDIKKADGFEVRETMTDAERAAYAEEVREEDERAAAEMAAFEAEQARRKKEYEEAEARRKIARENIAEHITVVDLDEETQFYCTGLAAGSGKESTLEELEKYADRTEEALVTRAVYFDTVEAYNDFCGLFLDDFEWLEGMGGTASEDVRLEDYAQYCKLTAEQRESVKFYCTNCVGVYVGGKLALVIDPEGDSYARYVFIVTDETQTTERAETLAAQKAASEEKPAFYIPAPIAEQVANIHAGQQITIYQCDGWILNNIEAQRGTVTDIYPGNYAQYSGYYIELANGGKVQKAFIRDGHEVLIYEGVKPRLPQTITERRVSPNMSLLLNYDELFPAVLDYYGRQGETPILDTIAR